MIDVLSWINKGTNAPPDWVLAHRVGKVDPNGTFLLRTMIGKEAAQARVLVGNMVVERRGVAFTRAPAEMRTFLAELEEKESGAYAALPKNATAPGEAEVADLTDDTDDISIKLSGEDPKRQRRPSWAAAASAAPEVSVQIVAKLAAAAAATICRTFPAPLGRPPSIENRAPAELHIDDSYQRSIDTRPSAALIERIARGWDWRMCLPLVVSNRNGELFVIDGQHRLAAAKLRGDIQFLPCCVAVYASIADEAAMFVAMNRARRAINRLDDFHAAQAGGDADAAAVAKLIEGVGFTVSRRTGSAAWAPGEVAFTSAIAKVRRKHGDAIVTEALQAMADAFPGERLIAGSSVFTALCAVLVTPPPAFDKERLFAALLQFDMKGWASFLDGARGGSDRAKHLRDMLLAAYDDAGKAVAA